MAIAIDLGTSSSNDPYIGVIVYFINENFKLKKLPLGIFEIDYPHTKEKIAANLFEIANNFDFVEKINGIVTDGASNLNGISDLFPHAVSLFCAFHRIQKSIGILLTAIKPSLSKLRRLVKFFRSAKQQQSFLEIQSEYFSNPKKFKEKFKDFKEKEVIPFKGATCLELDVITRGNSTFIMLDHGIFFEEFAKIHGTKLMISKVHHEKEDFKKIADSILREDKILKIMEIREIVRPILELTHWLFKTKYVSLPSCNPNFTQTFKWGLEQF